MATDLEENKNIVELKPAVKDPNNVEAKKYYIFNETGNIMIASTIETSQPLEESVQRIFAEVSVFFAGMTRAITTTTNPVTKRPYSIYNYHALERIIGGSGLFVHVTEEDVNYTTSSFGVDFSKELLEALLGLATGAGEMGFASAMMASIGKEGLRISKSESHTESKAGNIVFVCEYLLGMPIVSAIVVYADCKKHEKELRAGPCFRKQSQEMTWTLHKDTYLFVTPTFIRDYASDLDSIRSDPNYVELINWLQGLLKQTPAVNGVYDINRPAQPIESGSALDVRNTYQIIGEFLPDKKGMLKFAKGQGTISVGDWSATKIKFTVSGSQDEAAAIEIYTADKTLVVSTPGIYTIKKDKE
ncbi:MAG: hypothetical protein ACYS9Y_13360 [Planctomycetota bacterium]|jgi:hypothetical protein